MTPDVQLADVRETQIAYRDSGAAVTGDAPPATELPAFIWAHSLLASMAQEDATGIFDWTPLLGQARVIRYDARGHGASAIGPDPARQTWPELAADLLGLLDVLNIKRAVGGGASMGCGTLLHAACSAPERFPALVLALPPTAWSGRRNQTRLYRTVGMLATNPVIDVLVRGFSTARDKLPSPRRTPRRALISAGMDQFLREPRRTIGPFKGAALTDLPTEQELAALRMPCLILAWADDRMHPIPVAKRLHELLPDSDLMIATSDADILEWPKRVAEFLSGIKA